ncbi:MAG: hypothetical protein RBT49_13630 [Bacteroidales bacterium]|jgi:hypothetical protein|nr:hypothetical protein [Bacteroidales bacterium]
MTDLQKKIGEAIIKDLKKKSKLTIQEICFDLKYKFTIEDINNAKISDELIGYLLDCDLLRLAKTARKRYELTKKGREFQSFEKFYKDEEEKNENEKTKNEFYLKSTEYLSKSNERENIDTYRFNSIMNFNLKNLKLNKWILILAFIGIIITILVYRSELRDLFKNLLTIF